jgi:hypothetical protein
MSIACLSARPDRCVAAALLLGFAWASGDPAAAHWQDLPPGAPAMADQSAHLAAPRELPANSEVLLKMNQEVTTKGRGWNEGDTFLLSVVHDVVHDGFVVIPANSRAVGRITWLTNKGAFGKSGKMEIELDYVEVDGRRVPLIGQYRQEGEGNTVATIGGVVAAGVFAAFITGRSGTIPQGRELMARTREPVLFEPGEGAVSGYRNLRPARIVAAR